MILAAEHVELDNLPSLATETVIVGLGTTGLSCARYLARQGVAFAVTDSRDQPPGVAELRRELPEVRTQLGGYDIALMRSARRLIVSPGISVRHPAIVAAREAGVEIIGDVELFARAVDAPVIAITGSNGKSTVTALLGELFAGSGLDVRVGGNLGTPALDLLSAERPDYYVLELSSFQLETTDSLLPAAAVILNVSPDHLDRYPDLDAYRSAKQRIYAGEGTLVINADQVRLAPPNSSRAELTFGLQDADVCVCEIEGMSTIVVAGEAVLKTSELRLKGRHNLSNVLAALALAVAVKQPLRPMLHALRGFAGLPHRCQHIATIDGVDWIDDSKGTNVGSTCAAIHGLNEYPQIVLIAGGVSKGADFQSLADCARGRVRGAILLGRDAASIATVLSGVVPITEVATMSQAVRSACELARPGDAVLLSPACASFDMFTDFVARGLAFCAEVERLGCQ